MHVSEKELWQYDSLSLSFGIMKIILLSFKAGARKLRDVPIILKACR